MTNNAIIATTADGIDVYLHPQASHSHRPDLDVETIEKVRVDGRPFVRETVDLGRVIGVDHLVETTDADVVISARRENNDHPSNMVLGRKPIPTSKVSVVLCKCGPEDGEDWNGKYVLITLFEGDLGMPEPVGRNAEDKDCVAFWKTHALVPTEEELEDFRKRSPELAELLAKYA